MTADEIFAIWAPASSVWSQWVKPVLFAHMGGVPIPQSIPQNGPIDLSWIDACKVSTAVVVDLPGADSVNVGVALAGKGFRPIPLFNAIPSPSVQPGMTAVDVRPIIYALHDQAATIAALNLPPEAPPAFLLDAKRNTGARPPVEGSFDNRSISLPTDFPSATFLQSRRIARVVVLLPSGLTPEADLMHTLLRWRRSGIEILAKPMNFPGGVERAVLWKPMGFRSIFYPFLAMMGLKPHRLGGFGGMLPFHNG